MGGVRGVFSVCCNALALGEGWGLASLCLQCLQDEAWRGWWRLIHRTISQAMTAHMSSGREGRLMKSAARVWAVGVGRFDNNYKPGGSPLILHYGISDTTLASQVRSEYRHAAGRRLDQNDPGDQQ